MRSLFSKFVPLLCLTFLLASCGSDDDMTEPNADTTAPTVVSVSPVSFSTDVSVSAPLQVVFSEDMNAGTANGSVILTVGEVTGLSWTNARTLVVAHTDWPEGTSVDIVLTAGLRDLAGNALVFSEPWMLQIETTVPQLLEMAPADLATGVSRNTPISLLFSTAMDLNSLGSAITIDDGQAPAALDLVEFAVAAGTGNWAILTPSSVLPPNADITVTIPTEVTSQAGMTMEQARSFVFTTGTEIDATAPELLTVEPANGSTIDASTTEIVFTFSEAVAPSSLTVAMVSAQLVFASGNSDPVWSAGGTVMTIPLTSTLGAEMPLVMQIANFSDMAGNEQTLPIDYRVDVAGSGDPWPMVDGARFATVEEWTETLAGEQPQSGTYTSYYQVESQGGGVYRWANYWDPSYLSGTDYILFRKTATTMEWTGDHEVDESTSEVEDLTLTPGIQFARYPFAVGSWSGNSTATFTGGSAAAAYTVTVVGREDISSPMEFGSADVVWLDCWKVVRVWTATAGGDVIADVEETLWFAPSVGAVKAVFDELYDNDGVAETYYGVEEVVGGSAP